MYQTLISITDAINLSGDVVFVDCRHQLGNPAFGEEQYHQGHLPQARFAHLDRDLSSPVIAGKTGRHPLPEPEALKAFFGKLGIGSNTQVIAYDQDVGMFASRLWWLLRAMGHRSVAVLDGGYSAWLASGGAIENTLPDITETEFSGDWNPQIVDAANVLVHLGDSDRILIDARLPPRFKGLEEPLDPKAGHIPGAINLPFTENCENGQWRNTQELHERFGQFSAKEVVAYCGSGVTACHNILAFVHAGLPEPILYAGSWSEWVTDDRHPVATDI